MNLASSDGQIEKGGVNPEAVAEKRSAAPSKIDINQFHPARPEISLPITHTFSLSAILKIWWGKSSNFLPYLVLQKAYLLMQPILVIKRQ